MKSVSGTFTASVLESHRLAVRCEVLTDGVVTSTIDIVDGTITLDSRADVRGRCDITIADDGTLGLIPTSPTSTLAPYGNELRISRGIQYTDALAERVPLGVFRIQDTTVEDTGSELRVQITGQDRAARIIDARFEEPYQVASGTNYATAILNVLKAAWPGIPTSFMTTTRTTPALFAEEGADRWAFAQQMAASIAADLYFDGDGTCVLAPIVSGGIPVTTLTEGTAGVLVSAGRSWSREGAFNRVVARGEQTGNGTPVRGVATDANPLSPTYYFGTFGKVPRFYQSPFITTTAQASDAAAAILARELGTTQQVQFGSLVLPHLEPDDVVRITRARAGINEDHILDQVTIPLSAAGTMSGTTRAVQVTS